MLLFVYSAICNLCNLYETITFATNLITFINYITIFMKTIKLSILTIALALVAFSCAEDEPIVIPVVEVPTSDVVVDADNVYPNQVSYFFADKYWHIASSASGWSGVGEAKLYSSADGITWTDVTETSSFANEGLATSTFHKVAVYGDKLYLIAPTGMVDFWGTMLSDASTSVYVTTDGLIFTEATVELPTSATLYDVYALSDQMVISNGSSISYGTLGSISKPSGAQFYGPSLNSLPVVTSADGSTWTADADTIESDRFTRYAATVEHEGTLYQIGGQKSYYTMDSVITDTDTTVTGTCLSADVWSSTDGTTWTVAENVLPSARFGASAVSFGGKIWLFGGQTAIDETTDQILVSTDGVSWSETTQITLPAEYKGRAGHSVVVNEDELLIVGGYYAESDSTNTNMNDVWSIDISTIN